MRVVNMGRDDTGGSLIPVGGLIVVVAFSEFRNRSETTRKDPEEISRKGVFSSSTLMPQYRTSTGSGLWLSQGQGQAPVPLARSGRTGAEAREAEQKVVIQYCTPYSNFTFRFGRLGSCSARSHRWQKVLPLSRSSQPGMFWPFRNSLLYSSSVCRLLNIPQFENGRRPPNAAQHGIHVPSHCTVGVARIFPDLLVSPSNRRLRYLIDIYHEDSQTPPEFR